MADHGVAFKDRWEVTRERILGMKEIWTRDSRRVSRQVCEFRPDVVLA